MARTEEARTAPPALRSWLMKGVSEDQQPHLGPHPSPQQTEKTHRWWQVMCLTGVDYVSTLGYQPGIAALAAGLISPIATVVLVALTLFGALPVYRRVASESPNGEGSIAMLERLMSFWKGKIFVLVLLGFAATDFIITMTLSAADATAHLIENPHLEPFLAGHQVAITLFLLALLGAVFLRGFREAIGVAVMPHIHSGPNDTPARPVGRIGGAKRLLTTAAVIMSIFLITSSIVTTLLIPPAEFQPGGSANGRALAYLAHEYLGNTFGSIYDASTIAILWFAGASAMAGMLNLIPRYLPRYGMAPQWARAGRPLVLILTLGAFLITIIFRASVDAQGGAYATGVLVLITSAAVAVTLAARHTRQRWLTIAFGLIAVIFVYTTIDNILERPEGVRIASVFIAAILLVSLASRFARSFELRVTEVTFDKTAQLFLRDVARRSIRLVANEPDSRDRPSTATSCARSPGTMT